MSKIVFREGLLFQRGYCFREGLLFQRGVTVSERGYCFMQRGVTVSEGLLFTSEHIKGKLSKTKEMWGTGSV